MSNKAIVFDIQRSSIHDGPGIRTTVFLKGCPLECSWCHNPEAQTKAQQLFYFYDKCVLCGKCEEVCKNNVHQLTDGKHTIDYDFCTQCGECVEECNSNALKIIGKEMSVDEVMAEVVADIDFYNNSKGGITLSGGEPLIHFSFAKALLKSCKEKGINRCVETSGFVATNNFREILPSIDILLFDYKITGLQKHKKHTGVSNELILDNLDLAYKSGVPIILRCPIIPGINDTEDHFKEIKKLDDSYPNIKGIELLPYHSIGNNKRTSIGVETTLNNLDTTLPELSAEWLAQLKVLNCEKAKLG